MTFKTLKLIFFISLVTVIVGNTQSYAQIASSKKPSSIAVVFETSLGSFTLQLNPEKAPKTVANFLNYVDEGFYSHTLFHRAIPGFVVQAGGFEKGLKKKQTHAPVINESDNGLDNLRGTISMARTNNPDSATSQFFINLKHNPSLDPQGRQPGYTVFGKVTEGMATIDNIVKLATTTLGSYQDVPTQDVIILSAKRKGSKDEASRVSSEQKENSFIAGTHYIVLDKPVATRDRNKIEVVEMFSYGCPHCYEFEPLIKEWAVKQDKDIDFWFFPAVWNKPMKLFAQAFYAASELNILDKIHLPLFSAIVIKQQKLSNENDLLDFFVEQGVNKQVFTLAFNSTLVKDQARQAESQVFSYSPAGVPEIVVNGKYRVDRMRAGGLTAMLAVVDFLVNQERTLLNK